jgi:hypothetical protein
MPKQKILLAIAVISGLVITYVDSRPTWDDTGITAGAILLVCGFIALMGYQAHGCWHWQLGFGSHYMESSSQKISAPSWHSSSHLSAHTQVGHSALEEAVIEKCCVGKTRLF